MNVFARQLFINNLLKSIKNIDDNNNTLSNTKLNDFYIMLKELNEKELLQVLKNKKVFDVVRFIYSETYENLTEDNKYFCEKVDRLLYLNGLKELKFCKYNIIDIWKDVMISNPENLLYFHGELDSEMREKLIEVINNNPNLIYEYVGYDEEVISEAFKEGSSIEIKLVDPKSLGGIKYKFENNNNFIIKYILQYKDDFLNPLHNQKLKRMLDIRFKRKKIFPVWDYLINNNIVNNDFVKNILEDDYKFFVEYNSSLEFFKTSLFKKIIDIYGINSFERINIPDKDYSEFIKSLIELSKISINALKLIAHNKDYNISSVLTDLINNENIGTLGNKYPTCREHLFNFCKEMGLEINKDDIFKCPELYDFFDVKIDFTIEDFIKYSNLSKSKKIIKECLNKDMIDIMGYLYHGIDDEIATLAIEKGYVFELNHLSRHGYKSNDIIIAYLLKKDCFEAIREYTGNTSSIHLLAVKLNPEYGQEIFNNGQWELLSDLIKTNEYKELFLDKQNKIIDAYFKINDEELQKEFKDYVLENYNNIPLDRIDTLKEVLYQISISNSSEVLNCKQAIARQILSCSDPLEELRKIEEIFIKNNLPMVGKTFTVFSKLHPDFKNFKKLIWSENSMISPVLKSKSNRSKEIIIFADLLKASFGSNNRSVKDYLNNIEKGYDLFKRVVEEKLDINSLSIKDKKILEVFVSHLNTLYNNTKNAEERDISNNLIEEINLLSELLSIKGNKELKLDDAIIRKFCHFAGFNTFLEAKQYLTQKTILAHEKGIKHSKEKFTLEEGDFVKGVGNITYLGDILQNGSVAKEFLGDSADSDLTPLDTDLSRIIEKKETIEETINGLMAKDYGDCLFVLKNDERFVITRRSPKEKDQTIHEKYDSTKLEAFYTGKVTNSDDHYGIRTGFASSEIDYIISKNKDNRIGLEIALNGFYIPVVDIEGNLIFTIDDYNKLREKMSGLKHYDENTYNIATDNDLVNDDIRIIAEQLNNNELETKNKRIAINRSIDNALNKYQFNKLTLKEQIDGDLTEGFVELIDTGSTGRGTNVPGDGDFDFTMKLDKSIITDEVKLRELKELIKASFISIEKEEITLDGDFRFKGVKVEGLDELVDIDISFVQKTNKITYSTDMSVKEKLDTIKEQYPEKYNYVLANILLAKKVLKDAECYKPARGEKPQGGLGGVGVENWILQNGGSFKVACLEFLKYADGKTFDEFKQSYRIWDFGENHFSAKSKNDFSTEPKYKHDNFVFKNMNEAGYKKMVEALKQYIYSNNYDVELAETFTK